MSGIIDVRKLSREQRDAIALRIQVAEDFTLPPLRYWNSSPCRAHRFGWVETFYDRETHEFIERKVTDKPKPSCLNCGVLFRKHQRIGIMWAYTRGRGLIADSVGTGKMIQGAGLIALLKETGEIDQDGRVVICPRPAALWQWQQQLGRMTPMISVQMVDGSKHTKRVRYERYQEPWEVLLLGPQVLHNDYDFLVNHFRFSTLITDDVDALRNRETLTAYTLKAFGRRCNRMVEMTGTPLQKRLAELHSLLDPLGGLEVFGTEKAFLNRYTNQRKVTLANPKTGRKYQKIEITGHKHIPEFIHKMAPLVLRRTIDDITDVNLPIIMPPNNIFLDLYPAQREKYKELQKGVLEVIKTEGSKISVARAQTSVHTASMICGGLSVVGGDDGPGASVKLDWLMDKVVDGDLSEEKVVIFIRYINGVKSLQNRLIARGVAHETIWGEEPSKQARAEAATRFWKPDGPRILIGTTAIEQSLNFQCARHLINFDMIPNPGRVEQLVGRIRRDGSEFPHVYVHNLLTRDTHEMRLLPKLEAEQALVDSVWNEKSALFDALTPLQMMQLIIS